MESQHVAIPTGLMPPMYYAPMGYSIPIDSSGATLAPISPVSPESNYAILQQQQQQQQQQMQYGGAMEYPPPSSMSIGQQHSSDFVLPAAAYPTPMYAPVYDSAGNLLMVMGPQAYASSNSV